MTYKLICIDIDGTLLNKDRELSALTIREIKRVSELGIPVILISSRMPKAMRHLQEELNILNQPLIAYNGGLILDGEQIIETTQIDNDVLEQSIALAENTSIHISVYHNDDWFVPEMDYWAKREQNNTKVSPTVQDLSTTLSNLKQNKLGAHKIMCMGEEDEIESLFNALNTNFGNAIFLYRSKPTYIEIASKSISKATAINSLLETHFKNINLEEVMVFGDNYNDIDLFKAVGLGIAVENAKDELKAVAKDVTDTNKNDGVAKALQKYF